jgi:hypothetical protein
MAKAWRHLARSCEFVESLERFLLDGHAVNNALPSTRPSCPKCGKNMRRWELRPLATRATFSLLNALIADILKRWALRPCSPAPSEFGQQ